MILYETDKMIKLILVVVAVVHYYWFPAKKFTTNNGLDGISVCERIKTQADCRSRLLTVSAYPF